jgi:DNA invertase Pin-like site-specific DNA recombinase
VAANDKRRAGIYVRISKDKDGQRAGVKRQRADCEELARQLGASVVDVFEDDDSSAYNGRLRPHYERLLERVQDRTIDLVLAWHTDRLHRSPLELEHFIRVVEMAECAVRTVTAGDLDLSTVEGRMHARIIGAVARGESEHKSRRLRRKHAEIAKDGRPAGGVRPFGYDYLRRDDGSIVPSSGLYVVESEAAWIQDAVRDVLAGATLRSIARRWAMHGTTPKGNEWRPNAVRAVLLGPTIRGERRNGDTTVRAQWLPIIDAKTGALVARHLGNPSRMTSGGVTARKWVLSGFCRCGRCGAVLTSATNNGVPVMTCKSCNGLCIVMHPLVERVRDLGIQRFVLNYEVGSLRSPKLEEHALAAQITALGTRAKQYGGQSETGDGRGAGTNDSGADAASKMGDALQSIWQHEGLEWQRDFLRLVFNHITIAPGRLRGSAVTVRDRVRPDYREWP